MLFRSVDDDGKKKAIAESCFEKDWMVGAPVYIVICSKPLEAQRFYGIRGERLYSVQNAAAAAENMILMANAEGLGTCWVGAFDEDKIKDILGIVKEARPQVILPIGYPDEVPLAPTKYKLDNVVYFNKWWGRIKENVAVSNVGCVRRPQRQRLRGVNALQKRRDRGSRPTRRPPLSLNLNVA